MLKCSLEKSFHVILLRWFGRVGKVLVYFTTSTADRMTYDRAGSSVPSSVAVQLFKRKIPCLSAPLY